MMDMIGMKEQILDVAMELLELLELCDDDVFTEDVANAIYYNDTKALQYMSDELE